MEPGPTPSSTTHITGPAEVHFHSQPNPLNSRRERSSSPYPDWQRGEGGRKAGGAGRGDRVPGPRLPPPRVGRAAGRPASHGPGGTEPPRRGLEGSARDGAASRAAPPLTCGADDKRLQLLTNGSRHSASRRAAVSSSGCARHPPPWLGDSPRTLRGPKHAGKLRDALQENQVWQEFSTQNFTDTKIASVTKNATT